MSRRILTVTAAMLFAAAPAFCADASHSSNSPSPSNSSGSSSSPNSASPANSGSSSGSSATAGNQQQAPQGYVLVDEQVVFMMAQQPQQHLLRAHEQIAANNPKAAASELRMAAAYMQMQEARPGEIGKQLLQPWRENLQKLAGEVGKGDFKAQDLTKTAADTSYALAKYFNERAIHELRDKHEVVAGYDLGAAAGNFEQALAWSQQKPQEQEVKAIAESRRASDELITAADLAKSQSAGQSGEAQPASVKESSGKASNSSTSGANASAANPSVTQDASKAADDLIKSIDSVSNQFSPSPAQERGNNAGHASAGQSSGQSSASSGSSSSAASSGHSGGQGGSSK